MECFDCRGLYYSVLKKSITILGLFVVLFESKRKKSRLLIEWFRSSVRIVRLGQSLYACSLPRLNCLDWDLCGAG